MGRREQILATAATLFAERGFHGVSVAELGAACGISGPALYRHFASKDAMLAEMLTSISEELLAVAQERVAEAETSTEALVALIDWHLDFALSNRALIVVQDRDWASLPDQAREQVRATQNAYVGVWVGVLQSLDPHLGAPHARAMAQATFGLLNSTPRTGRLPEQELREVLGSMARRALRGPGADSRYPSGGLG